MPMAEAGVTLYTAGYRGHSLDALVTKAAELDAVVVDIRLSTGSWMPDWRGLSVANALGERYRWLPALGNLNYNKQGEAIVIKNPESGLRFIRLLKARTLILLCACPKYDVCHRKNVAEYLREAGYEVQELAW